MKRTPLPPRSTFLVRTRPNRVNRKRKAANHARAHGSTARIAFVNSLPCLVRNTQCAGRTQNAHIETGGAGRKADASKIVPLCRYHHIDVLHRIGRPTFEKTYGVDLAVESAKIEAAFSSAPSPEAPPK